MACEAVVQADPGWQAAMRQRGVEDFSLAMVDPWAAGYSGPEDDAGRAADRPPADLGALRAGRERLRAAGRGPDRRVSTSTRWRSSRSRTTASSPLPPKRRQLRPGRGWPSPDNVPASRRRAPTSSRSRSPSPRAPSFDGRRPRRRAGRSGTLRVGFTPREGLVLHEIAYEDRGTLRRSSTAPRWRRCSSPTATRRPRTASRTSSTMGEYGVGWLANPLDARLRLPGRDPLLRRRRQRPGRRADGRSRTPICMHEEDSAIGWKHTDFRTEEVEVRRLRRLVISFDRHRRQLRVRVLLVPLHRRHDRVRGQAHRRDLDRRAGARRAARRTARWSRPGLYGPHHQHFFCVRLDMAVDGNANTVVQVDSEPLPLGPGQPDRHGLGDQAHGLRDARREAQAADRPAARPLLADREPGQGLRARRPGRLQARPGRERGADVRAGLAASPRAPASRSKHVWVTRLRPGASASRPATTRTSTRAATACRATRRPTARPRTPTWCSGTRSAPTTSSGRRTGR